MSRAPRSAAARAMRHPDDRGAPLLIPGGHTSVMAGRQATGEGELDYFPTPPWPARAGGELIGRIDPLPGTCWEPACGGGHMAHGLADYFDEVFVTDIHDHGHGQGGVDFLDPDSAPDGVGVADCFDWIVTNPPFKDGEAFVRRAMSIARRGVAMLLRLSFLEGAGRHQLLHVDHPLTVVAPFAERVPMVKGRWDPDASSATAYAWFIWVKGAAGAPIVMPIAPGARTRLTRASDRVRFCGAAEQGELLEVAG